MNYHKTFRQITTRNNSNYFLDDIDLDLSIAKNQCFR